MRNVVAEVDPLITDAMHDKLIAVFAVDAVSHVDPIAFAVASRKIAKVIVDMFTGAACVDSITINLLVADWGVIVAVRNSAPSVICGIVLSTGITTLVDA